jgi:hypothetical protein
MAYDPVNDTWSTRTSMPTARVYPTADVINGKLYVVGGASNTVLSTNEAYDARTDSWSVQASMPTARYVLASGVINGILYAVGGGTNTVAEVTTNEAFTPPGPQTKDDCNNGGWLNFGFKNQGQCVAFVNHNGGSGN